MNAGYCEFDLLLFPALFPSLSMGKRKPAKAGWIQLRQAGTVARDSSGTGDGQGQNKLI